METGIHLLFDCRTRSAGALASLPTVYHLLENLPAELNMTVVCPPLVVQFPHAASELQRFVEQIRGSGSSLALPVEKAVRDVEHRLEERAWGESGVSGIVVIAESHLSVHTWPGKSYLSADFFSCKEFDVEKAKDILFKAFDVDPEKSVVQQVRRGLGILPE